MAIVDYYVDDGFSCLSYDRPDLLSKKRFAYTTSSIANTTTPFETMSFSYTNANWKEQLTAINGAAITYDQIGNPLNDGTWTYTWEKGRQLKSMSKSGTTASFKYNENGLRIQKTVNGVVTDYTIHGKNIVHMTQGSNNLHFFYDAQNKPAVVVYNGIPYTYVKNLQGDIVAILDSTSSVVVEYKYDAWGKPFTPTGSMKDDLGKLNPFRYRGYVYDEETEIYYLRSRYFQPIYGRFINADVIIFDNQYAYCKNSPLIYTDADGFALCYCLDDQGLETSFLHYFMTGGGGGGSSGGAYTGNSFTTGRQPIDTYDPMEQFLDDLKEGNILGNGAHIGMNVAGGFITTKLVLIGLAAPSLTVKAVCFTVAAIVGFSAEYIGTEIEEDLAPDAKFGGETDNTHPADSIKNGVAGSVVAFIPAQNVVKRVIRLLLRPGLKWMLRQDENDEE